ncbi:hypothetical protein K438DRAFT_1761330 [Mycena galopus ATCC 62051]|nr:hypothetical protein K438DRAFT_1761330 [Mycena galopus ATCC 62051]
MPQLSTAAPRIEQGISGYNKLEEPVAIETQRALKRREYFVEDVRYQAITISAVAPALVVNGKKYSTCLRRDLSGVGNIKKYSTQAIGNYGFSNHDKEKDSSPAAAFHGGLDSNEAIDHAFCIFELDAHHAFFDLLIAECPTVAKEKDPGRDMKKDFPTLWRGPDSNGGYREKHKPGYAPPRLRLARCLSLEFDLTEQMPRAPLALGRDSATFNVECAGDSAYMLQRGKVLVLNFVRISLSGLCAKVAV